MIIYGKIDSETLSKIFYSVIGKIEYFKVINANNSELIIIGGNKLFVSLGYEICFLLVSYYDGYNQEIDVTMVRKRGELRRILELARGEKEIKEITELIKNEAENRGFGYEL